VIRRGSPGHTTVLTHGRDGTVSLDSMFSSLLESSKGNVPNVVRVHQVASGRDPWLLDAPDILNTLRSLEARLPTLEEAGAKVGIGVATGADRVYVGAYDELPIEQERLLPLAMSSDLKPEGLQWSGRGLVNPWLASGKLAPLDEYPKFAAYLREHESTIRKRHTAQKSPRAWYKTIDRVYPDLTHTPKLLIPDIKGEATVVYDEGNYYPHHNLYVVTSRTWDLRALQAILKSSVALMFVAAYGIRMAGGFLRFQAQYLRRIRIPRWDYLQEDTQHALAAISESTDQRAIDDAVFPIFSLSHGDAEKVRRFAQAARVEKKTP
ncbi:MAG: modification methylase PaeR7I, partial [Deltaproteobacteria bacterium]|nr:modification methylase PaeR7I [Deltaproteobacteria bacterium]